MKKMTEKQIQRKIESYHEQKASAERYKSNVAYYESIGDKDTAEVMRAAARIADSRADDIGRRAPGRIEGVKDTTPRYYHKKKKQKKKKKAGQGVKFINALADCVCDKTLQYVTSETELKSWIAITKKRYGDDKTKYCEVLNERRDNLLCTAEELTLLLEKDKEEANEKATPGVEIMIEKNYRFAAILAEEIRKNGGKVNQ